MTKCRMPGCDRAAMTSSGGAAYTYCGVCADFVLSQAFAPERRVPEWVRRMQQSRGVVKDYTRSSS